MRTVFFDVDTQIDFLFPAGALYVPGAERILPAIAKLNQYAASHGILVVSTMDAHAENDPEFRDWPAHCVVGTAGQAKPASTLLDRRAVLSSQACGMQLAEVDQLLVEKQWLDCFRNPNLNPMLAELTADRFVVYGVVTEICVRFAALGLLATGERVEVVTDATKNLSEEGRERFFAEFVDGGGKLISVAEICG